MNYNRTCLSCSLNGVHSASDDDDGAVMDLPVCHSARERALRELIAFSLASAALAAFWEHSARHGRLIASAKCRVCDLRNRAILALHLIFDAGGECIDAHHAALLTRPAYRGSNVLELADAQRRRVSALRAVTAHPRATDGRPDIEHRCMGLSRSGSWRCPNPGDCNR
jgi:hypothetical protein